MTLMFTGPVYAGGYCPECGSKVVFSQTMNKGKFLACEECDWDEYAEDEDE